MATQRSPRITARPLTGNDWPVIKQLFGSNGACGGCWCMYWRLPKGGKLWEQHKGARNKRAFKSLLEAGRVHGCLAFADHEPVGWCCIGPREDFPRLERTKALATDWNKSTWSVVCFYIRAGWRQKGVASRLLTEATKLARDRGASELEAYPVRPKHDDTPVPAAFAWTGIPALFERRKFVTITPPGQSRDVYRRRFRKSR